MPPIVTGAEIDRPAVDFTGYGIGKILVPLMVRREARKEMPENIVALKRLMEEN
jgi:hypothetical protein